MEIGKRSRLRWQYDAECDIVMGSKAGFALGFEGVIYIEERLEGSMIHAGKVAGRWMESKHQRNPSFARICDICNIPGVAFGIK